MDEAPKPTLTRLRDLLEEGYAEAAEAHEAFRTGTPRGPRIPFSPRWSREIGGFLPVGLTVLHGPPGSAKTALANQIAAEAGCPALIVTCEMAPLELLRRHAARETLTFLSKFRTGQLSPGTWLDLVRRTAAVIGDVAILDGTRAPVTINFIAECAAVTKGDRPHLVVVVDSLHSWVRGSGLLDGLTEYEATNVALHQLQRLAADLGAAVVVVAEQNRTNMGSDRQEAAAGSRVFEYCAELVIALSRDRDAQLDADGEVPILATLAKNRHGSAGTKIDLRFAGGFMKFREGDGVVTLATRRGRGAA
jgi:replicative DNA helicase